MRTISIALVIILFNCNPIWCEEGEKYNHVGIAVPEWDGGIAIANIIKAIVEIEFKMKAKLYPANEEESFLEMDRGSGKVDIHPDFWMPNQAGLWMKFIEKGSRETVLVNKPYFAIQGLFIPKYVGQQYGLRRIEDLSKKEVIELFDQKRTGKGQFWPGASGWGSTNIEKVKAKSYGYGKHFEDLKLSWKEFRKKLKDDYENRRPILFYAWIPETTFATYDLTRLEEPRFNGFAMESKKEDPKYNENGCWKMYQPHEDKNWYEKSEVKCAWPDTRVFVAYSKSLRKRAPQIAEFLRKIELTTEMISGWILAISQSEQPPYLMAKNWVLNNAKTISNWSKGAPADKD